MRFQATLGAATFDETLLPRYRRFWDKTVFSSAEVEAMIVESLRVSEDRIGQHMLTQSSLTPTIDQARAGLDEVARVFQAKIDETEVRIKELITQNNATFAEHRTAMENIVSDLQMAGIDGRRLSTISASVHTALNGTKALSEANEKMKGCFTS